MTEFKFTLAIQPRFTDFDMLGHLNNATYITYFEVARINYFREIGWNLEHISNVVAHLDIDFMIPVFPGTNIICGIKTSSLGTKSFQMHYELLSEDKSICFSRANSVQVCIDKKNGKAISIPTEIRTLLSNFEDL